MNQEQTRESSTGRRIQLALSAASLFLFIVGLKRTFRVEDANGNVARLEDPEGRRQAQQVDSPAAN